MKSIIIQRKPSSFRRRASSAASSAAAFTVQNVKAAANRIETLIFEDVPEWLQENPYIRSGYRRPLYSTFSCIRSCTTLHNETLNIYTHLIPAIVLAVLQVFVQWKITEDFPEASNLDRFVIGANLIAAVVTFGLSASYHTLISHSPTISSLWLRIDYAGILTLILGSFFSGIYMGFYCQPGPRRMYWTMIVALSLITATIQLHPKTQRFEYRSLKAYAFVATALTGFAPIGHGLYLYGWQEMWVRSGMPYYFLEGILYGTGAVFFITRFPECWRPGRFDIWWSSHQIFHIFVVIAAATHMYGVWQAFAWNYTNSRTCAAPITS